MGLILKTSGVVVLQKFFDALALRYSAIDWHYKKENS
jgi:hypothetical protein